MFERVFSLPALLVLLGIGVLALLVAGVVGAVKREGQQIPRRFEAIPLAILGALLARLFVSLLIGLGDDSSGVCLAVAWAFLLWPGLVDTFIVPFSDPLLTQPETLLWIATGVGGFAGMMDGLYRIHNFRGLGWLSFPLDVTWGLGATTNACLIHLINIFFGTHAPDTRTGAHRYPNGFHLKARYAFTQGAAMSELAEPPGSDLFRHELLHVWQNRSFGPLFLLSYIGWAIVWFVPSLIAGVSRGRFGEGPQEWCYLNNPWETWAYAIQGQARNALAGMNPRLVWSGGIVAAWAVAFYLAFVAGAVAVVVALWT